MTKPSQPATQMPAPPLWVRLAAGLSLLLLLVASSIQAHHVHGEWLSRSEAQVSSHFDPALTGGDEASCALCMAMHSANPSQMQVDARISFSANGHVPSFIDRVAPRVLPFSQFSRPPPRRVRS